MTSKTEIVVQREPDGWYARQGSALVKLDLTPSAIAGEAVALVRARYDDVRVGVRGRDIGPTVAAAFKVLWLD